MATTASGELNSFHHLNHHSKHEPYHPYFNNNNFDATIKQRYSEFPSSPITRIISPGRKEDSRPTNDEKVIHQDLEKKKCSEHHFLPPIGDALFRRNAQHSSPSRSDKQLSHDDRKLIEKMANKPSEGKVIDDSVAPDLSENEAVEGGGTNFPIKSENSHHEAMIQQLSSRNISLFPLGMTRNLPPEDLSTFISIDSSMQGSVENFFRTDAHCSASSMDVNHVMPSHDPPSYTTLTPLQPLPSDANIVEKYSLAGSCNNYSSLMQKEANESGYNKMGGMGHSLPPLSNRIILAAQSRGELQTQEAIDAVNQVAAAVNLSHYNKTSVLPPNIITPPTLTSSSSSYESHMLTRLNPHTNFTSSFQNNQMFPHRARGFSPPYSHSFSNNIDVDVSFDKRVRGRQDDFTSERKKTRSSGDRLSASALNNYNQTSRGQQIEEVNTKEVADQITAELKRCSIPQAVFAKKVLARSQGTLSDLLRNPKPWSKLKSGRETFRKMWKWLQEPSNHRVQQLRLEGKMRLCHVIIILQVATLAMVMTDFVTLNVASS